jgi:hypothetical protein
MHPTFPSIKIDQYFQQDIEMNLEVQNIKQILNLLNSVNFQMDNKEYTLILQKQIKKIKTDNKAALLQKKLIDEVQHKYQA